MSVETHHGRCYSCGDEWTERTPPAICPECHSTNIAEVAAADPQTIFDLPIAGWALRGDEDDHERSGR